MIVKDIITEIGLVLVRELMNDTAYNMECGYAFSHKCEMYPVYITIAAVCEVNVQYIYWMKHEHYIAVWRYVYSKTHNYTFISKSFLRRLKACEFCKERCDFVNSLIRTLFGLCKTGALPLEAYNNVDACRIFKPFTLVSHTNNLYALNVGDTKDGILSDNPCIVVDRDVRPISKIVDLRLPKCLTETIPMLYILAYLFTSNLIVSDADATTQMNMKHTKNGYIPPVITSTIPLRFDTYNWNLMTILDVPNALPSNNNYIFYLGSTTHSAEKMEPFNIWSII